MAQAKGPSFLNGLRDGVPIGLGYLSVSFSFGLMAVRAGLPVWTAVLISAANLTSAGQVAGLSVIASGGALLEIIVTQLVINMRYALMSISLSQKADASFTTLRRMTAAFGITDEVFAVASSRDGTFGAGYLYGLIVVPFVGWTLGTFLGAQAGNILPEAVKAALGIAIYGMFIAIVVPPSTGDSGARVAALTAAALSCCLRYIPAFSGVSQGFAIVLCACAAAALAAWLRPLGDDVPLDAEGGEKA